MLVAVKLCPNPQTQTWVINPYSNMVAIKGAAARKEQRVNFNTAAVQYIVIGSFSLHPNFIKHLKLRRSEKAAEDLALSTVNFGAPNDLNRMKMRCISVADKFQSANEFIFGYIDFSKSSR